MGYFKMRATLRGIKPSVTRTFCAPADISFLDLHLIVQVMAGWGGRYPHRFVTGDKKIGAKDFGVFEEADETVENYVGSRMVYEYGQYAVDLRFLGGSVSEEDHPVVSEGAEEFPPDECKNPDEYLDVLKILDDPSDPSYIDMVAWISNVKAAQDIGEINKEFAERWERIGKIEGRIPFNVGATIGALLITGSEGFFYDTEKKILTEESDGSGRYLPIEPEKEESVKNIASLYAGHIGIKSDSLLDTLLEDGYRQGWEEYAENFLDEISDGWADRHGYIIECYSDSDIAKMMDAFGQS